MKVIVQKEQESHGMDLYGPVEQLWKFVQNLLEDSTETMDKKEFVKGHEDMHAQIIGGHLKMEDTGIV